MKKDRHDGGRPHQVELPFAKGSDTSEAAAESMATHAGAIRERVFGFILGTTPAGGTTCDNIEKWLRLRHQTASARVWELFHAGRIVDSGKRGRTRSGRRAVIYVVPARGPAK